MRGNVSKHKPLLLTQLHNHVARNAVEACEVLHHNVGPYFNLVFKHRVVPLTLRRVELYGHVIYVFKIAYTVDETSSLAGMMQFVGVSPNFFHHSDAHPLSPNHTYLANIHALPTHRWKGSDMVDLAMGIARALGVKHAWLYDATSRTCDSQTSDQSYDLSMIMLLSRQVTFYGRFGFRPVINTISDHGMLDSGDPITDMCRALRLLKRVHVSSFVEYLKKMLRHLDPSVGKVTSYRLIEHHMYFGVLTVNALDVSELKTDVPLRIPVIKRLLTAFKLQPQKGVFVELFDAETLSCEIKSDFLLLRSMGFPILRLGSKSPSDSENTSRKGDVAWPAWLLLNKVATIRGMRMEADVQSDVKKQRHITACT